MDSVGPPNYSSTEWEGYELPNIRIMCRREIGSAEYTEMAVNAYDNVPLSVWMSHEMMREWLVTHGYMPLEI